jgi:hypothetical protein
MGFKLKSGNKSSFKGMGSSAFTKTTEMVDGQANHDPQAVAAKPAAKPQPKMANDKWAAGSDAAKKNTGRSLNELVSSRKGLEKGSNEYNKVQNEINAALGNKKRYDVAADETKTGPGGRTKETTTVGDKVTKKTTSANGNREVTKVSTPDSKSKEVVKGGEVARTKSKTGLSTETRDDDVKDTSRVTASGDTKAKTRTATDVTKSTTSKDGEITKSKSRKRLGKGLVKGVVAKAKAKRAAKKVAKGGKVKGSKAPKGTTYDPSDDTSNMPASAMKHKLKKAALHGHSDGSTHKGGKNYVTVNGVTVKEGSVSEARAKKQNPKK